MLARDYRSCRGMRCSRIILGHWVDTWDRGDRGSHRTWCGSRDVVDHLGSRSRGDRGIVVGRISWIVRMVVVVWIVIISRIVVIAGIVGIVRVVIVGGVIVVSRIVVVVGIVRIVRVVVGGIIIVIWVVRIGGIIIISRIIYDIGRVMDYIGRIMDIIVMMYLVLGINSGMNIRMIIVMASGSFRIQTGFVNRNAISFSDSIVDLLD